MAIDEAMIGTVAAQLMEELSTTYGDDEGATIDRVAIVVAVDRREENTIHFRFSEHTPVWVGKGLLGFAHDHLG